MIIINNKNSGDDDAAPLLPHPIGIDPVPDDSRHLLFSEVRLALPSRICSSRPKAIRKLATLEGFWAAKALQDGYDKWRIEGLGPLT